MISFGKAWCLGWHLSNVREFEALKKPPNLHREAFLICDFLRKKNRRYLFLAYAYILHSQNIRNVFQLRPDEI